MCFFTAGPSSAPLKWSSEVQVFVVGSRPRLLRPLLDHSSDVGYKVHIATNAQRRYKHCRLYGCESVYDPVHHDHFGVFLTHLKAIPVELPDHRARAACPPVITTKKFCSSALNLICLVSICLGMWIPYWACIFQEWAHEGPDCDILCLLGALWRFSKIF